ncbi:hypothetical protein CP533_3327, partial [Ophiocordyceps camponoti-saundersi (nom. inval.)]
MAELLARCSRQRRTVLTALIAVRLVNAWSIATFFQPDEFFQALEPAWGLAFGPHSRPWLTWEWHHHLRTSLHPIVFALAYKLADILSSWLPIGVTLRTATIMAAPKLLQAVFAALGDWYTWQLAVDIYGSDSNSSLSVLLLQLFSPWQWYVSTRTFSNSLETTLTAMALYYWPWQVLEPAVSVKENPKPLDCLGCPVRRRASLCLAALAVVLRPTNVLIWATVAVLALTRFSLHGPSPLTRASVWALAVDAVLCGGAVLTVSLVSDRLYFGSWTFPPLHWLRFNISQSLAIFYGRNPWHYYLLQGIPLLCTTSLPFALWGLGRPASVDRTNTVKTLSATVLATVGILSLVSHKEVRFIYPLLPALNILAAPRAASFFFVTSQRQTRRLRHRSYLLAALGVNVGLAGYVGFVHQSAPLAVMTHLRYEYERIMPLAARLGPHAPPNDGTNTDLFALFLMPCHSTPWRSHLVYPGLDAYALSCEPPLHTRPDSPERAGYRDEADRFYDDPLRFLGDELFAPGRHLRTPRYFVAFESVEPVLRRFLFHTDEGRRLGVRNLDVVWTGFNGFFNEDARRAGKMPVFSTPSAIFAATGSVGISLMLWLFGGVLAFCGLSVYLEFGLAIPRSGGEKNYLERVYRRPRYLATCILGAQVVLLSYSAENALSFGRYILLASGRESDGWDARGIAVSVVVFAAFMHSVYPKWGIRLFNVLGAVKVLSLVFIVFTGFAALAGRRRVPDPRNFEKAFGTEVGQGYGGGGLYEYSTALLNVIFSYGGWSSANQVLGELKQPRRTLAVAAPLAVGIVTALYLLVNIAYFSAITKSELASSEVLVAGVFFRNMFGRGAGAQTLPLLVVMSSLGNVLAGIFAISRVMQEFGKENLLPFSRFWGSNKPFNTPAPA